MGDAAFRLSRPRGSDAAALLEVLRALPGVVDVVVTEGHVLVTFEPGKPPSGVSAAMAAATARAPREAREHVVQVHYDGEDLPEIAELTHQPVEQVIERHAAQTYEVKMIGFLPGFAYLGDLHVTLRLARRPSPRPRVAAGTVGIAGPYTGIYPLASPGGWHLVGRVIGFRAFDPERGATLQLGDRVRLERV